MQFSFAVCVVWSCPFMNDVFRFDMFVYYDVCFIMLSTVMYNYYYFYYTVVDALSVIQ